VVCTGGYCVCTTYNSSRRRVREIRRYRPLSPHPAQLHVPPLFCRERERERKRERGRERGIERKRERYSVQDRRRSGLPQAMLVLIRHSVLYPSFSADGSGLPQERLARARTPYCAFLVGCRFRLIFLRLSQPLPFHPPDDPVSPRLVGGAGRRVGLATPTTTVT